MTPTRARIPTRKPRDQPAGKKTSRANFARRTVAYRTLKELFDTGELTGMESPSAVYNMHDVFKKYNIDQFRTGFNNFKSDFLPRNGSLLHFSFQFVSYRSNQTVTRFHYRQ